MEKLLNKASGFTDLNNSCSGESMKNKQTYKILVIDDEPLNCHIVKNYLSNHHQVFEANNGRRGLEIARMETPDLILLDLNMPEMNGFQVCGELRSNEVTRHIPVIIVTSAEDTDSRIRAFDRGADDFIQRPFSATELLARVQSKIRRLEEGRTPSDILVCGNLEVDDGKHEIRVAGEVVAVGLVEYNLVKFLSQNKDRVMTRSQILDHVWKDCAVSSRTIDAHILSIRKKLIKFNYEISSIYGVGYGFMVR